MHQATNAAGAPAGLPMTSDSAAPVPGPTENVIKPRVNYVDAAKGVAVILVVLWHAVSDRLVIFEALMFVRMPLFFFAAGLFAQRGFEAPWHDFIKVRVGQIFWLYCLWVPIVYYATSGVRETVQGDLNASEIVRPLLLFVDPPLTLWFLYALGLMYLAARLARPFAWEWVLSVSLAGYFIVISGVIDPNDDLLDMLCRVIALSPFFLIAAYHSRFVRRFVERRSQWGFAGMLVYLGLSTAIVLYNIDVNPFATFTASAIGILSLLMLLHRHDGHFVVQALTKLGSRSLFVFVLHRIPLFYYTEGLKVLGLSENVPLLIAGAFAIVAGCWVVGEFALSRYARWTMEAPWLIERRARTA